MKAFADEAVAEVRAQKACRTGNENSFHKQVDYDKGIVSKIFFAAGDWFSIEKQPLKAKDAETSK